MSISVILLLIAAGVLILPNLGGDDDDDENTDNRNEILGGSGNDNVTGTSGNDLIRTFLGNDRIDGGDGNDEILAGDGEDFVIGGAGLDFIRGGDGNDEIYGNDGNDRIIADRGDDYVDAGRGADIVRGGAGSDTILGGINADFDEFGRPIGNFGVADQLFGEDLNDLLIAWGGGSTLNGGLNDPDEPDNLPNDDTLVTVTGESIMENRTGTNTNIALANIQDEQGSRATVLDFRLGLDSDDDTLVLTVDHSSDDSIAAPVFDVQYSERDSSSGEGTRITVSWTNANGVEHETASAFLVGRTPLEVEGNIKLEIYLTQDASYTDPLDTLDKLDLLPPTAVFPSATI